MTLLELREILNEQGRSMVWLARKLGYTRAYIYNDVIGKQNKKEIGRIKGVLGIKNTEIKGDI